MSNVFFRLILQGVQKFKKNWAQVLTSFEKYIHNISLYAKRLRFHYDLGLFLKWENETMHEGILKFLWGKSINQ